MAHQISTALKVKLPAAKVWQVLNDYQAIEKYAPTIKSSVIEGDVQTGLGAKRRVTFHHDGSSLVEKIVNYEEGRGYTMAVSELAAPMKTMQAEIHVESVDADNSEIFMTVGFEVKGGPFGWLLATLLLKPMMKGVIGKVVNGLAYYAATGESIDKELPKAQKLQAVVG